MSTVKALVISPEGVAAVVGVEPGLENLQAAVGGYVEYIEGHGWIAFCDEDGKLKRLPVNAVATNLARQNGWLPAFADDYLVGPVVFFGPYGPDEQYNDVPQRLVDQVRSILTN